MAFRCLGCFGKPTVKEDVGLLTGTSQHAAEQQDRGAGKSTHRSSPSMQITSVVQVPQIPAAVASTSAVPTNQVDENENSSSTFYSIQGGQSDRLSDFGSCRNSFSSVASASALAPSLSLKQQLPQLQPDQPATLQALTEQGKAGAGSAIPLTAAARAQGSDKDLDSLLRDAAALYNHYPCRAYQAVLKYCEQQGTTPGALADSLPAPTDTASYTLRRLLTLAASLQLAVSTVQDHTGWHLVRNDALKIWYKHTKGGAVHDFKGECILETPMEHVLALAREFDLVKTWNHYVVESAILHEHSPAELLCLAVIWMPWPLHNIDLLVEASGCDMLDSDGAFMVAMQTPKQLMPGITLPAKCKKDAKLCMMPGSCMRFQPLAPAKPGGPPRVRATVQAFVDAGIKHVPEFIITFVLKVFGPFIYTQVLGLLSKHFAHENDPLPIRLRTRTEMYGLIRARAAAFMEALQGDAQQAAGQGRVTTASKGHVQQGAKLQDMGTTPEPASP